MSAMQRVSELESLLARSRISEAQLLRAIEPVYEAFSQSADIMADNWDELAHVEITLSIRECRKIRKAINEAIGIAKDRSHESI